MLGFVEYFRKRFIKDIPFIKREDIGCAVKIIYSP
jgi:hypothetical protein